MLNGRPAGLVARIDGAPVTAPMRSRIARRWAARSRGCTSQRSVIARGSRTGAGRRGGARRRAQCGRSSATEQNELLQGEVRFQTGFGKGTLPKGAIHGDLFCDNVLFADGRVAGIIDFGFAATDFFAYDLAIAVNDWCVATTPPAAASMPRERRRWSRAYHAVRPLTDDERAQWTALLRAAALRFWVSRLYDLYLPRPGELTHAHDPTPFERILRARAAAPARPLEL